MNMNNSPCLSDYKERFYTFTARRIQQLRRRLSLHKRLYNQDNDNEHLVIIEDCMKNIQLLEESSE